MKIRITAILLIFSILAGLTGCFPSGKKVEKKDVEFVKISVEELSDLPKRIDQTVSEKLTINADVNIEVKNSFNVYTAKNFEYDLDKWCALFFKKGDKVTQSVEDETVSSRHYGFARAALYPPNPFRPNRNFYYVTQEYLDKDLTHYYERGNDPNGTMCYNRDTIFAKKELNFMSSETAKELVDQKMKQLGIATDGYKIYSMDYDHIKAQDEADFKLHGDDGIFYTPHDKNDEFYIIIPKIKLPNESVLTEVYYTYPVKAPEDDISIYGGATVAIVDKNGLSEIELRGIYDVTGEKKTEKIMDLNSALEIIKGKYSDSTKDDVLIDSIELSYTPYLVSRKEGTFELKPTWVFSVIREWDFGEKCRTITLVDAVDGNVPKIINSLGLD